MPSTSADIRRAPLAMSATSWRSSPVRCALDPPLEDPRGAGDDPQRRLQVVGHDGGEAVEVGVGARELRRVLRDGVLRAPALGEVVDPRQPAGFPATPSSVAISSIATGKREPSRRTCSDS